MDFLKAELNSKRKALEQDSARPNKYMRRGELEKLREEQERKERQAQEKSKLEAEAKAKSKQVNVSLFDLLFNYGLPRTCGLGSQGSRTYSQPIRLPRRTSQQR